MNHPAIVTHEWTHLFPMLDRIDDPAWISAADSARIVQLPEDRTVYRECDCCEHFLLLMQGSIRVQKSSENGSVITLYHLEPGHACELTVSCLLAGDPYPAEAVTETAVELVMVPAPHFREALAGSARFRECVLSSLGKGVNDLVTLVEEVAFGQMDGRLARCLLVMSGNGCIVEATHQELAVELGSAREVISRLLKRFERHGHVRLHRGMIEIIDHGALQKMAAHIDR